MKKIIFLTLSLLLVIQLSAISQTVSETNFAEAKTLLLFTYQALETDALELRFLFEQKSSEMNATEQSAIIATRSDLELGMLIVKDVLRLYILQGAQASMPSEAKKILIDASLDATGFLHGLRRRLEGQTNNITNREAKGILDNSFYLLSISIEAINTLRLTVANMQNN